MNNLRWTKFLAHIITVIVACTGIFLYNSFQKPFYLGTWNSELTPASANITSLTYEFTPDTFMETSDYVSDGMNIHSSTISYFKKTSENKTKFIGSIFKKELKKLSYSFIEPTCKDPYDCQKRELIKKSFESMMKQSVESNQIGQFTLYRIDNKSMNLESVFGKQKLIIKN